MSSTIAQKSTRMPLTTWEHVEWGPFSQAPHWRIEGSGVLGLGQGSNQG